ncbi:sensor histidine kinase [Fervidobacterium nodosum]|uniref:histidine kinase n=1 Tax=Fervidobacterium nodosum (strain ATCC 35602 / DSM 5306 / Rt17-B1) TaxID=381764 RepID=A7HN49_FERNB|nr:ATP-binding protein [Fervidobacterium nodosum]ABS61332.1 PAS/PAC sensor signal transduction histidine kinase [Fervidobacterium nodosum Rt17-B1]PHJ13522.1 histidine kinase [Fervidobacterium sp. SC_NGM5_G05]
MIIYAIFITVLALIFSILFFLNRKNLRIYSRYLDKIAITIGEEVGTPPLYIYERLRKKIEELEKRIFESEKERRNIFTILNNITDPIIIVRGDGVITFANIAGRDITRPGIEGRKVYDVVENYFLLEMFEKALETGEIQSGDVVMQTNGETRYYDAKVVPIKFDQESERYIIVLHDTTKEKQLDKLRREFISNVSHELRTPLTSIHGYAEALLDDDLSNKELVRKFLGVIESESARMTRLINDLLDLEKLESGDAKFNFSDVNMCKVIERVVTILEPLAEDYGVELYTKCECKSTVYGDFDRLVQLVLNLVDNAVKYTSIKETGEKKVFVKCYGKEDKLVFEVQDTGPGIPEDAQKRLFERFYRVDKARSRKVGGTGLGLSIVKMIADKHNATISFESKVGEGTTFRVYFKKSSQETTDENK